MHAELPKSDDLCLIVYVILGWTLIPIPWPLLFGFANYRSYQRKADELDVKAQFYPELFDQMDLDKKDLSSYLQWCLQEKGQPV